MAREFQLGNITLGYADGENEAKEDWFVNLFYDGNGKVEELLNNRSKFIISGRKGTGKTILAKYIEQKCRGKGIFTAVYNKENFSIQYIIEKGSEDLSEIELSHFLKYSILIQIAKLLIKESKNILISQRLPGKFSMGGLIRSVIRSIACTKSIHDLKTLYLNIYPDGAYRTVSLEQETGSESKGSSPKNTIGFTFFHRNKFVKERKSYAELEDQINSKIMALLEYCNVYVFFDDLDELGESIYTKAVTNKIFIGLLEAARSINNSLLENKNFDSKCIIMLRTDIIDGLHSDSSNSGKMVTDCQVKLNWLVHPYGTNPLQDMLLTKIGRQCFKGISNQEIFEKLFPPIISGKPFMNYLLDFSFGRPRDVVNYLNIIILSHKNSPKFFASMFTDSEVLKEYSSKFLIEIKNEMSIHFSAEIIDKMFALLKNFGRRTFEFSLLEQYYNSNIGEYSCLLDLKSVVKTLFRYGVLGNSKSVECRSPEKHRYRTYFSYREDGNLEPDFNKRFIVHYALRKVLSLS